MFVGRGPARHGRESAGPSFLRRRAGSRYVDRRPFASHLLSERGPMHTVDEIREFVSSQFALRNRISNEYIPKHSEALAAVCREMAERFRRGGRLLAAGVGAYATDAQHVSVEFVHPVIVGKRALPALDLSMAPSAMFDALARPDDIVMGFAPPEGDAALTTTLDRMRDRGALVCSWPGSLGRHPLPAPSLDPLIHQ